MLENIGDFNIEKIYAAGIFQNEKPSGVLSGFCDRVEAVFVNSGKLIVSCGAENYVCGSGTAVLFKSGESHYIKISDKEYTEYLAVSFSVSGVSSYNFTNKVTLLTVLQKQLVQSICNMILASGELNAGLPAVFTEDKSQALKLAATIKLLAVDVALNEDNLMPQNSRDAIIFQKALFEMESKVLEQLSLENLAEKLGISLSHLKRIFASFSDVGVHEYFMGLKIREAIKMLKGGHSVTETAELTGFNNQNYFSAAFKRIVGVSPKEYCGVRRKNVQPKAVATKKESKPVLEKKTSSDMPSYLL